MTRLIFALYLLGQGDYSQPPVCEGDCQAQLQIEAEQLAALYALPEGLLEAVMYHESRGDAWAVGSSGEFGPIQIWPSTAEGIARYTDLTVESIMSDPIVNLQAGAWLLNSLLVMFGSDVDKALAAYNGGPSTVLECDCISPELAGYVSGVHWAWNLLREPVTAFPIVESTPNQWFEARAADLLPTAQCLSERSVLSQELNHD